MTYSVDFRKKVLKVREEENLSMKEVGERFKIGVSTVMRWSNKIEPKKKRDVTHYKIDREALKKDVEDYPDSYDYERAKRFKSSRYGIQYALKQIGVTYKKNTQSSQSRSRKAIYVLPDS